MRRFNVPTSDNKYVQYRLMAATWSTDIVDWINEEVEIIDIEKIVDGIPSPKLSDTITGYLTDNGSWNSNGDYKSLILDIRNYKGCSITVESALPAKQYAFLKTFNTSGTSVFCSGCSKVFDYPVNEIIPDDCNYIYLTVKNANVGNVVLPEINISNADKGLVEKVNETNERIVVLETSLKGLEKSVNGNVFLPPTSEDAIVGNMLSDGLWNNSNVNLRSFILDISSYKGYKITASSSITTKQYAFLRKVEPPVCWLCDGCSRVSDYPVNETIPDDCNYIYLLVKDATDVSVIVPDIYISGADDIGLIKKTEKIDKELYGIDFEQPTSNDVIEGNLYSGGDWGIGAGNTSSIVIDISSFRGHKISAISELGTKQYAFLKTFNIEGISEFCDGCSRVSDYPTDEIIPADCNYLYLLVRIDSIQIIPYLVIDDIEGIKPFVQNLKKRVCVSFDSVNNKFSVFQRLYNTDIYTMLEIVNDKDLSDLQYVNVWRLKTYGGLFRHNGETFEPLNIKLLIKSENEFAFKYTNTSDFTGGYHGDERIDIDPSCFIRFYIDGLIINSDEMTSSFDRWCNDFYYEQRSTLHETSPISDQYVTGHPIIAYHLKTTSFIDGGYNSVNRLDINLTNSNLTQIQTSTIFTGLACISKDSASIVSVDTGNSFEMTGSDTMYRLDGTTYPLSITLDYKGYNKDSGLSSHVISRELTKPSSGNNTLAVWDRSTDSKYYGYAPNRTFVTGDIFVSEIKVRWEYKSM